MNSIMSIFTELFDYDLAPNANKVACDLSAELSRYCTGKHDDGRAVALKARKTVVKNVYVAAESVLDDACIVVDTDDNGIVVELTVYNGGPAMVSRLIKHPVNEIEEACGAEGRGFGDVEEAVQYWQSQR